MTPSDRPRRKLGVVVVNYGTSRLLERSLGPLTAESPQTLGVVVDNFTTYAEQQRVAALADRYGWLTVLNDHNAGFGAAVNTGADRAIAAGAHLLLVLNPDATIDHESLDMLRAVVEVDPDVMAAPRILRPNGAVWFDGVDLDLGTGRMRSRRTSAPARGRVEPWLSGACLMVSARLWTRIGGFDERYFLYWEDVDLSYRVREAGGRLRLVEEATAIHEVGGSQSAAKGRPDSPPPRSTHYYYYNIRNRLLFAATHLDDADRRRWRRTAIPAAYEILMRGGRHQFLKPGPPLRAAVTGLVDGLRFSRRT